jgi:VCBS repeat-containing protein
LRRWAARNQAAGDLTDTIEGLRMDNDLIFGTETSEMLTGAEVDDQIAAVLSAAMPFEDALPRPFDAAQVVVPEGTNLVRIPVTAGEFVALPFPADAHFLARIDDGNLAIRVGDVTVILQGYVEAARQTPPVIEAADGQPLDIATILAETDPAIEIETAAGPAEGQGADNTGAFFQQLGALGGLEGFQGAGALDSTASPGTGTGGVVDEPGDKSGTQFLPFSVPVDVAAGNVAPKFQNGVDHIILVSEDIENVSLPLTWVITDPDDAGHTITADPSTLPDGVTYDSKAETMYFDIAGKYDTMKQGDIATFTLKFTITDDRGASTGHDVTLDIIGVNDAPVARPDIVLVDAGADKAVLDLWALAANDTDVEGDALHTSSLDGIPKQIGDSAVVTIPPDGSTSMLYTVSDRMDDSQAQTVTYRHDAVDDGNITGTNESEILFGTGAKEMLDGGNGNDIIIGNGGGYEVFGGGGDDILVYDAGSKIHGQTDLVTVRGGLGADAGNHGDILALPYVPFSAQKLDFSDHASVANLDGIETISMQAKLGAFGRQLLTLGAASVQDLSDQTITPGGVFAEHEAIRIDGDAVDQLYLSISKDGGSWTNTGVDASGYRIYAHQTTAGDPATADAYVMVSSVVPTANVHLNADAP